MAPVETAGAFRSPSSRPGRRGCAPNPPPQPGRTRRRTVGPLALLALYAAWLRPAGAEHLVFEPRAPSALPGALEEPGRTRRGSSGESALAQLAASLSPGQWAALATDNINPALTNTGGSSNMIFGYADAMKWDPVSRRMLYLGSDHGGNPTPGPNSTYRFVAYSEDTNRWSVLPTPPWVVTNGSNYTDAHGYDKTAINAQARRLYRNPYNSKRIRVCDLDTGVWSLLPDPPDTGSSCCDAIEYFPERGGLVWSQGTGAQLFFNESSQQWSTLGSEVSLASTWMFAEYNPVHRVVILGSSTGALFKLSSTGGLTPLGDIPVEVYDGTAWNGVVTVDPVRGDYLVLTPPSRQLHSYDVVTDTWHASPNPPPDAGMDAVLGTPIAAYGVIAFTHCHHSGNCGVWLYRHAPEAALFADGFESGDTSAWSMTWP